MKRQERNQIELKKSLKTLWKILKVQTSGLERDLTNLGHSFMFVLSINIRMMSLKLFKVEFQKIQRLHSNSLRSFFCLSTIHCMHSQRSFLVYCRLRRSQAVLVSVFIFISRQKEFSIEYRKKNFFGKGKRKRENQINTKIPKHRC